MRTPKVGDHYADRSTGRVIRVVEADATGATVETVRAADAAVSERAVGKQTHVSFSTLRKFHYVEPG